MMEYREYSDENTKRYFIAKTTVGKGEGESD
jgi:hypothetical protein